MAKQKLRKIVVDGVTYLWRFNPGYERADNPHLFRCRDVFTAWTPNNKTGPLKIVFVTWENPIIGGPLRMGTTNLHTPKWAETLIRAGLKRGWQPNEKRVAFTMGNGVELLVEMNYQDFSPH